MGKIFSKETTLTVTEKFQPVSSQAGAERQKEYHPMIKIAVENYYKKQVILTLRFVQLDMLRKG